jgi:hypothetical protein
MSRPAVAALDAYDHFIGPPGSGKTAALAVQIDATLRASANPYLLAVITPSEAGAEALRQRVEKLSGVKRTEHCQIRSLDAWLRVGARQSPARRLVSPVLLDSLANAAFAQAGLDAAFGTPTELLEEPVDPEYRRLADYLEATLDKLGLARPSTLARHPEGRVPLLDFVFVDDLHLMPHARPWLELCLLSATRAVVTTDPAFPAAEPLLPLRHFRTTHLRARERRRSPPSLRGADAGDAPSITPFGSVDLEIQHMLERLNGPEAPSTVVCASAQFEARLLIRAALTGVELRSPRADSVYCSTELRLVSLVLRAIGGDHDAISQLLLMRGVDRRQWLRSSVPGYRPTVVQALAQPEDSGRAPTTVQILGEVAMTLAGWRRPNFLHVLIDQVASWCRAHAKLERPWIFDILASEVSRLALGRAKLGHLLEMPLIHQPSAAAPVLLRPEDLDGHIVSTLWLSLTSDRPSARADAFVYRAVTRAAAGVVISRADVPHPVPAVEGSAP